MVRADRQAVLLALLQSLLACLFLVLLERLGPRRVYRFEFHLGIETAQRIRDRLLQSLIGQQVADVVFEFERSIPLWFRQLQREQPFGQLVVTVNPP